MKRLLPILFFFISVRLNEWKTRFHSCFMQRKNGKVKKICTDELLLLLLLLLLVRIHLREEVEIKQCPRNLFERKNVKLGREGKWFNRVRVPQNPAQLWTLSPLSNIRLASWPTPCLKYVNLYLQQVWVLFWHKSSQIFAQCKNNL